MTSKIQSGNTEFSIENLTESFSWQSSNAEQPWQNYGIESRLDPRNEIEDTSIHVPNVDLR